ncbi:MAG: amidohydrolase [Candidatus Coatesbacteria bacterium]|nr:amidohydrolase [Candidatus Coatesbacteria bacterium]
MSLTKEEISELIDLRRHFHRYPEIAFKEEKTANFIADRLGRYGYKITRGIAKTGVLAELKGNFPGDWIMLRADMDALPVQEETKLPFESAHPGIMHACGHDAHIAILLTVAKNLVQYKERIKGGIKILFQPAEECGSGAVECLKHPGLLDNPKIKAALGLHVWQDLPTGYVGITPGPVMAGVMQYKITINGKGGHGAIPEETVDPVVAAAHLITLVQTIVSRNVSPLDTGVVTVGLLNGGTAFNIIPEKVILEGTARYFRQSVGDLIYRRIDEILKGLDLTFGTNCSISYDQLTPPLVNDTYISEQVLSVARKLFPKEKIRTDIMTMGGEDMSYIANKVPCCFFLIGSGNPEKDAIYPHHSKFFKIDEDSLQYGYDLLFEAALNLTT